MPFYYDTPGLMYDSGATYDAAGPTTGGRKMPAEVAYNLANLDPHQVLDKILSAHAAVLAHAAVFTTPSPSLASVLTAHNNAAAKLIEIDRLIIRLEGHAAIAVRDGGKLGAENILDGGFRCRTD